MHDHFVVTSDWLGELLAVTKGFVAKKPNSVYRLTPAGRKALTAYVKALKTLLGGSL
jgi:Winged helix DNA-binding domain